MKGGLKGDVRLCGMRGHEKEGMEKKAVKRK